MPKTKNVSISFTATPELKDQLTTYAKDVCMSRSKTIATMVSECMRQLSRSLEEPESADKVTEEGSLKQLEIEKLAELCAISYAFPDGIPHTACGLHDRSEDWFEENETEFARSWECKLNRFMVLADEVNNILWQVDNSTELRWAGYSMRDKDIYEVGAKLLEYGLIAPSTVTPATAKELWDFYQGIDTGRPDDTIGLFADAAIAGRMDIMVAVAPWKPPVERGAYWKNFYTNALGTKNIEAVWGWHQNPEASQICDELTEVMKWDEPSRNVQTVLNALHENKDPFYAPEPTITTGYDSTGNPIRMVGFGDFLSGGRFQNYKPETRTELKTSFHQWHSERLQQLDQDKLKSIYKVVFGCDWQVIEAILLPVLSGSWGEILGVPETCSLPELKTAYRNMAKLYHTDVNNSELAQRAIRAINNAKEAGEKAIRERQTSNPWYSRRK